MLKSNQLILGRILKVAIVLVAAVMLALTLRKFIADPAAVSHLKGMLGAHLSWLIVVILLLPLNWFLETAKWKKLVSTVERISWKEAWSGVLAGVAIGSVTPNRVGEFTGRVFQMKSTPFADGLALSFVSSFLQVATTMLFGFVALMATDPDKYMHSTKAFVWMACVGACMMFVVVMLRNPASRIGKYFAAVTRLDSGITLPVFGMSVLRYITYSTQFYIMLRLCGVESVAMDLVWAICINYLIVTIVPSVMFSELLVRGTVASGVIGGLCGNPGAAAIAAVILWIINIGIPATAGLFFVKNISFFRKHDN